MTTETRVHEGTLVREADDPADQPLQRVEPRAPARRGSASTPMEMIALAVKQGADPEKLDKLMALQERWEANEAKKAFAADFVEFKKERIEILKNANVRYENRDQSITDYDHATLHEVCTKIIAALSKYNLSHAWRPRTEGGRVYVTTVLRHSMGYEDTLTLDSGPDKSGGKNDIQAIGSAISYLERYGLLAITGHAVKGQDDDGRRAGVQVEEVEADPEGKKALEACGSMSALQKAWAALTVEQRHTLAAVKDACKKRIAAADAEAAK